MKRPKTVIVTIEGTTELNLRDLANAITEALPFRLADSDFSLTQKVKVQVAQQAKQWQETVTDESV